MKRAVFLNGPPQSGKTQASRAIANAFDNAREIRVAHGIDLAIRDLFWLTEDQYATLKAHKEYRSPLLFGMSLREVEMSISENFMKWQFGDEVFGRITAKIAQQSHAQLFVIDCGFADEARPVADVLGRQHCLIVHLHRNGYTFDNDSRSYWELECVTKVDMFNVDDLEMHRRTAVRTVQKWLETQQS